MSESTVKGAIAEAAITAVAVELGVVVLRPMLEGAAQGVLLVADSDGGGKRVVHRRLEPAADNQRSAINSSSSTCCLGL